MMPGVPILIHIQYEQPPEVSKRKWREFMRAGMADMGAQWHTEILPKHFTQRARTKYGHKKRGAEYNLSKRRRAKHGVVKQGGRVDNVFSGTMRKALEQMSTIRAFPSRATLQMRGPNYISMRPKDSKQPHKAREITTVTQDEEKKLSETLNETVGRKLAAYKSPKTVRP
jgi:hypothetical protein